MRALVRVSPTFNYTRAEGKAQRALCSLPIVMKDHNRLPLANFGLRISDLEFQFAIRTFPPSSTAAAWTISSLNLWLAPGAINRPLLTELVIENDLTTINWSLLTAANLQTSFIALSTPVRRVLQLRERWEKRSPLLRFSPSPALKLSPLKLNLIEYALKFVLIQLR